MIEPGTCLNVDVTVRRPTREDAQPVLALMKQCDIDEFGQADASLEDLLFDWNQIALDQDAWLAFTPEHGLVGYAALLPWGADVRYDFDVTPDWHDPDLGQLLLTHCETRAPGYLVERGCAGQMAHTFVAHVNQRDQTSTREAGFRPGRYFFQMRYDLLEYPPAPTWPEGVGVRSAIVGQDDRPIFELIRDAFARPGRTPVTFHDWKQSMMRRDIFDPNLWFLAVAQREIVGACLCFAYPDQGWVRQLGVANSWRRKGVATALLRHAFTAFARRGFPEVGLSVESERPDAHRFYQRVGMKQARQYDEFVKVLKLPDRTI